MAASPSSALTAWYADAAHLVPTLQALLDDPELYARDPAKFAKASEMLGGVETELAAAEEEWLELEIRRETLEG